jgi:hypothetical protein
MGFLRVFMVMLLALMLITLIVSNSLAGRNHGQIVLDDDEEKLIQLIDSYKSKKMPLIAEKMLRAKDDETVRLGKKDESRLVSETSNFFNELLTMGKGTQAYQSLRGKLPNWNSDYLGIERALMMGRALQGFNCSEGI